MATRARKKIEVKEIKDRLRIKSLRTINIINEISLEEGHEYTLSINVFNDLVSRVKDFKSLLDTGIVKILEC